MSGIRGDIIPNEVFAPILDRLIKELSPWGLGVAIISERSGLPQDTIRKITERKRKGVQFNTADKILCAARANHLWWEDPLKDIYYSLRLL